MPPTQKEMLWLQKNRPDVYSRLSSRYNLDDLPASKTDRAPTALGPANDPNAAAGSPGGNMRKRALNVMIARGVAARPNDGMANRKRKNAFPSST